MEYFNVIVGSDVDIMRIMTAVLAVSAVILIALMIKVRMTARAKAEFVGIIAHKFRTPLTSVRWTVEDLIKTEQDNLRKQNLMTIEVLNRQLINLTNTLIEVAESGHGKRKAFTFETVLLAVLINEKVEWLKKEFSVKNISFTVECEDPAIKVSVDKQRFEFVLNTVLQNSCIYTPVGGKVDVQLAQRGSKAYIVVADNGIGIPKNELHGVFKEFHRSQNAQQFDTEGLGVGLYLARTIINRLGGKIAVHSEGVGKGTVVTIKLPAA